jgi:predicted metalloprotease with PDZ domain
MMIGARSFIGNLSICLSASLGLGVQLALSASSPAPALLLRLQPGPMDIERGLGYVDVTLTAVAADAPAGSALLTLPIVIANTETIADTIENLQAIDDLGIVPLTSKDDPEALSYSRHWIAGRAVKGDLIVRYRAPIDDTPPPRGSGPPLSLRTEGGGFSGAGNNFVLLPETKKPYRIAIRWDLSALGKGATATSSYGDGDVEIEEGPVERLSSTGFMAGPMQREPVKSGTDGFSSAWLGAPPFDPHPLMVWTRQLHAWMSHFFRDTSIPPYRVFLRFNPINAGGGVALTHSFLATYNQTTDADSIKDTLAHEMVHTWTSSKIGQWYSEGNAVYYANLLPLRAGLIGPETYLKGLNTTAARYYANILNTAPNDQIATRFWEDSRIRVLPYDRGAMYFAVLNGRIRRASHGKRSIDDLINEMVRLARLGQPATEAIWIELLTNEIGSDAKVIHASMLAGGLMLPESDDFGPCFSRTTTKIRRFDLGFDPKSLVGHVKTIRGAEPDSQAVKAGLRNGDVVTYAVAIDLVQSNPTQTLTLQVSRDDKTFPLTYLPRGESVDVWQWARVPGIPDAACIR